MGFTTGLLGGFTLTASILYLSTELHARNRAHQAAHLRQQASLIENIYAPAPPAPPQPDRRIQAGIWETAKDKWNATLEKEVRQVQNVDWQSWTQRAEESVGNLVSRAFDRGKEAAKEVGK
ncbi:Putative MICOS complex subunit Mic12 protein [Septoria linicola]|uniref:MICOS complex subunit MIC12 n=1 Tax=Septoria linicola TaxID=215465 RepID=A0A9Q9B748_9PEZI|nr:putative MICOS complex subunit Mic12 protein [Septoria linicola]USW58557.1 Putative MICOS complex subunit Mic12 protein [Septoria linicola]